MKIPKTHPVNVSYLVVGLVFLGIAGSWALRAEGIVGTDEVGWLLPLILVSAGAIGLVAFAGKSLSRSRGHDHEDLADVEDLEAAAYAPYDSDVTDVLDQLDQHHQQDQHDDASDTRTPNPEGDHR
jgi:hypothetical protein